MIKLRNISFFVFVVVALCACDDSAPSGAPEIDRGVTVDRDGDEVVDSEDTCPDVYNPEQSDLDGDGLGDLCDVDDDGDGVLDTADGCPTIPDPKRIDTDGDGQGDACDLDDDGDGVADSEDACPLDSNFAFGDLDGDGRGDACDRDRDGDGVNNEADNCPDAGNATQEDVDGDGLGNECDVDADGDGVANQDDNCRLVDNADQLDFDEDGVGDLCDYDRDGDDVDNIVDNCPDIWEPGQADRDEDGLGDVCDMCPLDPNDDSDRDGFCSSDDNCPIVANEDQLDADGDGQGDACDPCVDDPLNDLDRDGWCSDLDNCPTVENPDQSDTDGDTLGDVCDECALDRENDADGDDICGNVDLCPGVADPAQSDLDQDGLGDFCDLCPLDNSNDPDQDGVCNDIDNCPEVPNPPPVGADVQSDRDGDGLGDACDRCLRGDAASDPDQDGVCAEDDNCPMWSNPNQADTDRDGLGDVCDLCRTDPDNDLDQDGLCGDEDVCPTIPDPAQDDADEDGVGDRCDPDVDGDGVLNDEDNCPFLSNEDQADTFGGPQGDVCELLFFYEDFEDGLEGWEQSGRWVVDESAAFRGQAGLVEGDNQHTQTVAINSPAIDLSRSERPRLSFWVRRQNNQTFNVDIYADRDTRQTYRVSGASQARPGRDGYEYYTFDLRGMEGRDGVRVRFRMDGNGGWGRLSFDEVTLDENPSPPSRGIPFRDEFDTLENWRPSENSWVLAGPALTPNFAATVPARIGAGEISTLDLSYGIDLRATRNPRLVIWFRSGGELNRAQRLELLLEPANAPQVPVTLLIGRGNTLYERKEVSLIDLVGDPDVRIKLRYHHENGASPAVFVDSFAVEETPRPRPPVLTPRVVDFPNEMTDYESEGWNVVRGADGVGRLVTTMNQLPGFSTARARVGPFDLTGLRHPLLRVWARYALERNSQSFMVDLLAEEHDDRRYTFIKSRDGGSSGLTERLDYPLNLFRGDRGLTLEFLLKTDAENRDIGLEIERVEIVEDPAAEDRQAPIAYFFEEDEPWSAISGDWEVVPNLGTDGSNALLATSADGLAGADELASVQLAAALDLSPLAKPRLSFDVNYLDVDRDHTLRLFVESRTKDKTYYLLRYPDARREWNAYPTEGYVPIVVDLDDDWAGEEVSLTLEVVANSNDSYAFTIDNFRVYDANGDTRALLTTEARGPYRAYLNGELVRTGEVFGVAETAWISPQIGRNVLAIETDSTANGEFFAAALDLGRETLRTGVGPWRMSEWALDGWNTVGHRAGDTVLGDFEDRAPYGALADFDPDVSSWWVEGEAFGVRPEFVTTGGVRRMPVDGEYVLHSRSGNNDNHVGSVYSPPFQLERSYLHFMMTGGTAAHGSNGGCLCVRLWSLDENGERSEIIADWTRSNSGDRWTMEWQSWAVPEQFFFLPVQIEVADERGGNWGWLVADDFYMSDHPQPRGIWTPPSHGGLVGVYMNNRPWSLFDTSYGAKFLQKPSGAYRFYRLEFEVTDRDGDGIPDGVDLCPDDPEPVVADVNRNGVGDRCDPCPDCRNVALGKVVNSSGSYNNDYHHRAVIDGNYQESREFGTPYDYWLLRRGQTGWVEVDLRRRHRVCSIRWKNTGHRGYWSYSTGDWRISSFVGDVETQLFSGSEPVVPDRRWKTQILDECIESDRIRFYVDSFNSQGGGLSELQIFGEPVE